MTVPDNKIVTICDNAVFNNTPSLIIDSFKGNKKRDWFINHAYFCLPLVIGNQYGYGIKSLKTFSVIWNGNDEKEDCIVEILEESDIPQQQYISSHFGMGTVTIQNRFTFRTPPGVNLMTINPPNYWIDGIQHMTGVIETDNNRRDFTFNLKVTRKNEKIIIKKGDYIGCILPIPRYFVDKFEIIPAEDVFTENEILEERESMLAAGHERTNIDIHKKHHIGRRYFKGEDIYGNKFDDHQNKL